MSRSNLSSKEQIGLMDEKQLNRDMAYSLRVIKYWVQLFSILTIISFSIWMAITIYDSAEHANAKKRMERLERYNQN